MTDKQGTVSRRVFGKAGAGAVAAAPMIVASTVLGRAKGQVVGQTGPPAGQGQGGGRGQGAPQPVGQAGVVAPSDRIIVGGIGLRSRGMQDLRSTLPDPRVKFVAIADIRESAREAAKSTIDQFYKTNDSVMYRDAGELLAREDIEAVMIATSDRWHACMASWAAQSGKDIYCEKPAAISIAESFALHENVKRFGVIYQAGCQRRNVPNFEIAVGLARGGMLGKLQAVHADDWARTLTPLGHSWWPEETPEPNPLVMNWDGWLGPCPWRPWNARYPDGGRSQFWDFHAGILEWASHTGDVCQWAADCDHTHAITYEPVPNTSHVNCTYANGVKLVFRGDGWGDFGTCRVRFEGSEGWVETGDSGKMDMSENLKKYYQPVTMRGTDPTRHIQDWLDCIRSRSQPRANAESTCNAHVTSHCAYIACQLERKVTWDPAKRAFVNDEEANRMRSRAYREPWRLDALATNMG
jgi:predicted dehydrogenase